MHRADCRWVAALVSLFVVAAGASRAGAADHGDTPLLNTLGRSDAKLTDLHAFTHDGSLVLALSTNPAVPTSAARYRFSPDVVFRIHLDRHSEVSFADTEANDLYGGTVVDPAGIGADVTFEVRANPRGRAVVRTRGIARRWQQRIRVFGGLRDDPFIRGPREGRNVGAIVIELPLEAVVRDQSMLLIWATSSVDGVEEPFQDMAGRALRSMFPENDLMNTTPPELQAGLMGVPVDVMLFDTAFPAAYPNGRALEDDVVDLVGDERVLSNDAPFPSTNDRPFLDVFPYLATPHPPL